MRRAAGSALALVLSTWPGVASACPVCFDATEANRNAFLGTTVFMSLLPLAMVGAVAGFLFLKLRHQGEGDE